MKYTRIKGDVPQNTVRLPRLGKIRLGIKARNSKGVEYPKETDYFVCPEEVKALYGETPTRLPVMLPVEDEDQICRQYYAVYGANQRLKCQGDGETFERRQEDGSKISGSCPRPDTCEYSLANGKNGKPGCRARIDLMVVLPGVSFGGVYQLSSGSINTDIDIRSGIEMARNLYQRASWVPMELVREPMKIAEPGTNKMNTHYPCKLLPIANLDTVMAVRKDPMLIPAGQTSRYEIEQPQIEGPEPDTPVVDVGDEEAGTEPPQAEMQTPPPDDPAASARRITNLVNAQVDEETVRGVWQTLVPEVNSLPQKLMTECTQNYLDRLKIVRQKMAGKKVETDAR